MQEAASPHKTSVNRLVWMWQATALIVSLVHCGTDIARSKLRKEDMESCTGVIALAEYNEYSTDVNIDARQLAVEMI